MFCSVLFCPVQRWYRCFVYMLHKELNELLQVVLGTARFSSVLFHFSFFNFRFPWLANLAVFTRLEEYSKKTNKKSLPVSLLLAKLFCEQFLAKTWWSLHLAAETMLLSSSPPWCYLHLQAYNTALVSTASALKVRSWGGVLTTSICLHNFGIKGTAGTGAWKSSLFFEYRLP